MAGYTKIITNRKENTDRGNEFTIVPTDFSKELVKYGGRNRTTFILYFYLLTLPTRRKKPWNLSYETIRKELGVGYDAYASAKTNLIKLGVLESVGDDTYILNANPIDADFEKVFGTYKERKTHNSNKPSKNLQIAIKVSYNDDEEEEWYDTEEEYEECDEEYERYLNEQAEYMEYMEEMECE